MACTFQGELANYHALSRRSFFCVFQNRSVSSSYVLTLLQNSWVNHVFLIAFETSSTCTPDVQLSTSYKSIFCQGDTK